VSDRAEVLNFITANIWRENPKAMSDLRKLLSQGAEVVGLNEARNFAEAIERIAPGKGYVSFGAGPGNRHNNPVLIHDDVRVIDFERRTVSDGIGDSPERTAVCLKFQIGDEKFAVINTHFNSHVQKDKNTPWKLPRVDEFIEATKEVTRWVNRLRKQGYKVVVMGDLNWAWMKRSAKAWWWSPQRAFRRRSGLICQFDKKLLPRPRGDARPIEYVLWHPDDFVYLGQKFVKPEHSDHPFHEVTLRPRKRARA
jgi:endonuclease/exonuclease/phosphatase family metal-dependent hydrolase